MHIAHVHVRALALATAAIASGPPGIRHRPAQNAIRMSVHNKIHTLYPARAVYPCGGTSKLESGLKVHHYSCVQMRMRIKISTFPRQQKDPLLCLMQKPCYYPSIIRN